MESPDSEPGAEWMFPNDAWLMDSAGEDLQPYFDENYWLLAQMMRDKLNGRFDPEWYVILCLPLFILSIRLPPCRSSAQLYVALPSNLL